MSEGEARVGPRLRADTGTPLQAEAALIQVQEGSAEDWDLVMGSAVAT